MPGTRSSARQAARASSSPTSSHDTLTNYRSTAGSKRKGDATDAPRSKRGRKGDGKEQTTIDATMPIEDNQTNPNDIKIQGNGSAPDDHDNLEAAKPTEQSAVQPTQENNNCLEDRERVVQAREDAVKEKEQILKHQNGEGNFSHDKEEGNTQLKEKSKLSTVDSSTMDQTGKVEPSEGASPETRPSESKSNTAVEKSSEREDAMPSSILEKGIIYFFFRGRVGIDEPSDVGEIARSYIVLRPIPHGSKLGYGPIGDAGSNRLLALPKKVLPISPKDRFMVFVEKANASMEDIKSSLASSDYATRTAGTRHTPAAAPIGEGVYAITTTGRDSHIAYILTLPSKLSDIQADVGLKERGSFATSVKNPQYAGPANTNLPKSPAFPQK